MHQRVELLELAEHDRQDAAARAGGGADLEPPLQLALRLLPELGEHLLLEREQPLRPAVEPKARLGRLDAATRPVEELLAEALLERADLQTDRGLGHAELVGGLREAAVLDDRAESCELTRVHKNNL